MKVLKIQERIVNSPKACIVEWLPLLASKNDKIWPFEKWPAMRFRAGLKKGSKGGHGPIKYTIVKFDPNGLIEFKFNKPIGFNGVHRLEINSLDRNKSKIIHTIDMNVFGLGI